MATEDNPVTRPFAGSVVEVVTVRFTDEASVFDELGAYARFTTLITGQTTDIGSFENVPDDGRYCFWLTH